MTFNYLKTLLFAVGLTVSLHSAAQGYKKERLQLIEQYNQIHLMYDSSFAAYDQLAIQIKREKSVLLKNQIKESKQVIRTSQALDRTVAEKYLLLERLNKKSVEAGLIQVDSMPVNRLNTLDDQLDSLEQFQPKRYERSMLSLDSLSTKPRKSDIAYLKRTIVGVQTEKLTLEKQFYELYVFGTKLDALNRDIRFNIEFMIKRNESLNKVIAELDNTYRKARADFEAKGPNGFSKAYFEEFPDCFPTDKRSELPLPPTTVLWNEAGDEFGGREYLPPPPPPPAPTGEQVYTFVDEQAEFPGGHAALKKYLAENLKYPQTAIEMGLEGTSYIQFIISKKGNVSNVKVVRSFTDCPECDAEAVRLVKAMPQWKPAKKDNQEVNSTYNLPVKFRLTVVEEKK